MLDEICRTEFTTTQKTVVIILTTILSLGWEHMGSIQAVQANEASLSETCKWLWEDLVAAKTRIRELEDEIVASRPQADASRP
jgi:hypothetical protein